MRLLISHSARSLPFLTEQVFLDRSHEPCQWPRLAFSLCYSACWGLQDAWCSFAWDVGLGESVAQQQVGPYLSLEEDSHKIHLDLAASDHFCADVAVLTAFAVTEELPFVVFPFLWMAPWSFSLPVKIVVLLD